MSTKRIGFIFLFRWAEQLMCDCSPEERHEALDALLEYARNKTVPTAWASPLSKALFCGFKREYDDMEDDYDEKCRKNKENINCRWRKDGDKTAYDRIQSNTTEYDRKKHRKSAPKTDEIVAPQLLAAQTLSSEITDKSEAESVVNASAQKGRNALFANITKMGDSDEVILITSKREASMLSSDTKQESIQPAHTREEAPLALQFDEPQREKTRFEKFQDFLKDECPYINEHLRPLTEDKFQRLLNAYGAEIMCIVCRNIENRVDLRKRYKDLFLTMNNWCKLEKARREDGGKQITR